MKLIHNSKNFVFTTITASDGEEDILTCKPQWEVSQLNLPKFNSEEGGAEQVDNSNLPNFAKTKTDERRQVTGLSSCGMMPDAKPKHKKPSSQKVMFICNYEVSSSMNWNFCCFSVCPLGLNPS
jgi:hypothetical protein